jgi:uncharacterized OsmC-like protein
MQPFPHKYLVTASALPQGDVELSAEKLPDIRSVAPVEFDGPGNLWSPESLLVAAVGDCLALTFRGIARASKLDFNSIQCHVTGMLEKVEHVTQFSHFEIHARVEIPADADPDLALRVLQKAEQNCLIANSLKATVHLVPDIHVEEFTAA